MTVGKRLKQLREQAGISQVDFASELMYQSKAYINMKMILSPIFHQIK